MVAGTSRRYLANPSAEALDSPQFRCSFPVNERQSNIGDRDVIFVWNCGMQGLTKHLDIK